MQLLGLGLHGLAQGARLVRRPFGRPGEAVGFAPQLLAQPRRLRGRRAHRRGQGLRPAAAGGAGIVGHGGDPLRGRGQLAHLLAEQGPQRVAVGARALEGLGELVALLAQRYGDLGRVRRGLGRGRLHLLHRPAQGLAQAGGEGRRLIFEAAAGLRGAGRGLAERGLEAFAPAFQRVLQPRRELHDPALQRPPGFGDARAGFAAGRLQPLELVAERLAQDRRGAGGAVRGGRQLVGLGAPHGLHPLAPLHDALEDAGDGVGLFVQPHLDRLGGLVGGAGQLLRLDAGRRLQHPRLFHRRGGDPGDRRRLLLQRRLEVARRQAHGGDQLLALRPRRGLEPGALRRHRGGGRRDLRGLLAQRLLDPRQLRRRLRRHRRQVLHLLAEGMAGGVEHARRLVLDRPQLVGLAAQRLGHRRRPRLGVRRRHGHLVEPVAQLAQVAADGLAAQRDDDDQPQEDERQQHAGGDRRLLVRRQRQQAAPADLPLDISRGDGEPQRRDQPGQQQGAAMRFVRGLGHHGRRRYAARRRRRISPRISDAASGILVPGPYTAATPAAVRTS